MPLDSGSLRDAVSALGAVLKDRGQVVELAVVGGGALLMLGLIRRPTKDLDVVARIEEGAWLHAEPFPRSLLDAVRDVALALELPEDWINPGPTDLLRFGLPEGFASRATVERFGTLTLHVASRVDQIALKVYAAADQWPDHGKHLQDLRALGPTPDELGSAARRCQTHDPSAGFRDVLLRPLLAELGAEL